MSGRPTNRTGRPIAPPIDSAANTGASANRRVLTTINAPPRFGSRSWPFTATSQRRRDNDQILATKSGSRPQSSTM